ncbi:hypothetical protein EVAR_83472_1 [Eumeta japonica]|uniref:Uncharacterized protein n=1 Tax=Eumeta variegata TaxID=151549 RepID=A0A4C1ZIA7_EUMVA|nr:hypothetical protein EVAR_83472_1 [Eumeta japonica]
MSTMVIVAWPVSFVREDFTLPAQQTKKMHPTQLLANRHLVKLGLIKSERKRCPLLTTPPHCKKSADHRKRAHREEAIRVRAYAAIAEIAVTAGPSFAGLS